MLFSGGWFRLLFLAATIIGLLVLAPVVAGEYIPPPLSATPPVPETPSPMFELIKTFRLPNPEEVAVDPTGAFFLSGTNDGFVSRVFLATGETEIIFTPRDFRPGFFGNATNEEIRGVCDGSDLAREKNCGRVLGIKFEIDPSTMSCESIWLANAYFGIFRGSCQEPFTLERRVSIKGGFVNDIEPRGAFLYYTITHGTKQRNQLPFVVLDDEAPAGSLHRLDISTYDDDGNTELIADGIYFANGLASSTDGAFIYVAETTAARILRYDVFSRVLEPFLEDLPVLPNNIAVQDGELLVPGYTRDVGMEALLANASGLSEFLAQDPEVVERAFREMIAPHGNLLVYEEATGKLKQRIFQSGGVGGFSLASSAHKLVTNNNNNNNGGEPNGYLVGSVFVSAATWFKVIDSTDAPTVSAAPTSSMAPTETPSQLTPYPSFPLSSDTPIFASYTTIYPTTEDESNFTFPILTNVPTSGPTSSLFNDDATKEAEEEEADDAAPVSSSAASPPLKKDIRRWRWAMGAASVLALYLCSIP